MALWSELANAERDRAPLEHIKQQLMLVPEAPVLLALLLIGWAYSFPPAIGVLAALTVAIFVLRLLLLTLAQQQLGQGNYRQADSLTRAALRIYPLSVDALSLHAKGLLLRGKDVEAEALLRRAAELAPDSEAVQGALAGALLLQGDFAGGREHASYARRLAGGSPYAAQPLAWLALHVDDDPAHAQRILGEAEIDRLPATLAGPLLVLLAEAQLARGATQPAMETIRRLDAMIVACPVPQQAELCYHLGRLHALAGGDGRRHFRHSIELDPHGRYAHTAWRSIQ